MVNLERYITTGGIAVFVAYIGAIFMPFRYDSGGRGLASGAVSVACLLEILWLIIGLWYAAKCWRTTNNRFRITLLVNALVVCFIFAASLR